MNKRIFQTVILAVFVLAFSGFALAQRVSDMYVISVKAGKVNHVEGKVSVEKNVGKSGVLLKGDSLEIADKVTTGIDGRAEILLNPGSYLRLAESSQFEFVKTDLDNLEIKLTRGSAILEVITNRDEGFLVTVDFSKQKASVLTSGIYRFDVEPNGNAKIEVWKGKAKVGNDNAQILKSGNQMAFAGSISTATKFDRDDKDAFEIWSKERAKQISALNAKLEKESLRNSLLSSYSQRPFSLYNSYGLWVFDARTGMYCFLPFGFWGRSPYGYGFGRDIWDCSLPSVIIYTPPISSSGGTVKVPAVNSDQVPNTRPTDGIRLPTGGLRDPFKDAPAFSPSNPTDRMPRDNSNDRVFVPRSEPSASSPPPSAPSPSISLPSSDSKKDN
jgi:hypothetical protein